MSGVEGIELLELAEVSAIAKVVDKVMADITAVNKSHKDFPAMMRSSPKHFVCVYKTLTADSHFYYSSRSHTPWWVEWGMTCIALMNCYGVVTECVE
jgi:hypothetical protein